MTITSMMCMKFIKFMKNGHRNPRRIRTNSRTKMKSIIQVEHGRIEQHIVEGWRLLVKTGS